ncbi:MAG: penicillin-binding protein 2 [Chloroflexi bacterium]|nr:penicillin-binding protein 2 [Chloroflexota bacterium]
MRWADEGIDPALPLRRLRFLQAAIVILCGILIARLWWVQIACGDIYDQMSQGTRTRHIPLRAPRGAIYDCEGRLMATTAPQYMVAVDPIELRRHTAAERASVFGHAAAILSISVAEIQDILDRSRQAGFNTIKLMSGVGPAVITHLLEESNELPGVDVEQVPVRSYPMGAVGAHVLGYLGDITAADLKRVKAQGYNGADQIGLQGLERSYESELRGVDGERVVEVNARGVPVSNKDISRTDPVPGKTLVLTLDSRLQQVAQQAFPDKMRGSVVAIDTRTGGVLALVSRPGFDPNVFVQDTPPARAARVTYLTDPAGPMQDRAVTGRYPPGSTFKMVTSAAGFANNAIDPHYSVWCAAGMRLGGRHGTWKKCWSWHGSVNYLRAMAQSCDTYFYDLMRRLSSTQLAAMCRACGLGHGFIPSPGWKDHRFRHERWWFGDSCNMAIGQGFLQVTPLQMALVTASVANGGTELRPHLVQEIKSPTGVVVKRTPVQVNGHIPISPAALKMIQEGMRAAVTPGGTAGVVRFKDLAVAAKTGSAQDVLHQPTHAWFVCYAPYDNPRIAICSMVEHGGHGGGTAGPIARAILKAYFHLKDEGGVASVRSD